MEIVKKQKKRVCFVSPKAYPIFNPDVESVFGGAEIDTYMIATELAKDDGFDVSFIVADYGQPEEEVRENIRILKSVDFKQNPLTGAWKIWRTLKKADADVYMMKTASPGVTLVQSFCRMHHKRFIYKTAHQRECDGSYIQKHRLIGRLFIRSLQKASLVLTQNESDADSLCTRYGIESITIPNAHRIPDTAGFDKNTILWVGRSIDFKKPARFFELAKAFPHETFVMICQQATGDTSYQDLKAAAAKIGNLKFIDRVPFAEIDGYFERAKVFVNTSDSEGFPNTFIQACKVSVPILSLNVNPDGFLDEYGCGVCCSGDIDRLVDETGRVISTDAGDKMGACARKYVEQNHNITKIIEQYKELLGAMAK
ncbi:MAG: glycosyltransferase family 4 protein [Planctomycetota bacterium]|jgi:glycosyltransferase involved in cell wall biosynthesis